MKEMIKSYHVFLPFAWERFLLYLVYPLAATGFVWFLGRGFHPDVGIAVCANLVITAELFFDMLVFGGIGAKDTNKLEYIKTSTKGMGILQSSLIGDGIRRVISVTGIHTLSFYLLYGSDFKVSALILCILLVLLFVEVGLFAVRMISFVGVIMAIIMLIGMIAMSVVPMVAFAANSLIGVGCLILCVFAMVGERKIMMCRVRRSYYDGRSEKRIKID